MKRIVKKLLSIIRPTPKATKLNEREIWAKIAEEYRDLHGESIFD